MNKGQKEAIWLLGLGTFLEYFDLMLYIHMAFFLNDLFFPKTYHNSVYFISALTFGSILIFRPFGAFIFGWLGDNIGRKATVSITTIMMAISSIVIANLPTYEQIGITATWIITACRILQGMASIGEVVGAELYIMEITKPPIQYPAVASIAAFTAFGSLTSLGLAYIFTNFNNYNNWRNLFWLGAILGIIGIFTRIYLRETIDFVDAKRRLSRTLSKIPNMNNIVSKNNPILNERINKKTFMALLLIHATSPLYFCLSYIYCGNVLKADFGFTNTQVIYQNFLVCIAELSGYVLLIFFCYRTNPMILIKIKIIIFFPFCLVLPYLLTQITTPQDLLFLQCFIMFFAFCPVPAIPIFLKYFPVFSRFTGAAMTYALSRAAIYLIASVGFIYLEQFGKCTLLLIIIPINVGFIWGVKHFLYLESIGKPHHSHMV